MHMSTTGKNKRQYQNTFLYGLTTITYVLVVEVEGGGGIKKHRQPVKPELKGFTSVS